MEQDDPESEETGEEVRQPPNVSDGAKTPSNEELQTEETPVQPMDPVSDNGDNSKNSSNRNEENKDDTKDNHESKHEAEKDDTEAPNDDDDHDEETASVVDESLSPQGAGALPSRTGINES